MIRVLVGRELISLLCSAYSFFFALVYLLVCGLMLWVFQGSYNILDNGYATLERFFWLSSVLLMVLIPALTMRTFSDEIKSKTLLVQLTRPITLSQLFWSKVMAVWVFVVLTITSTGIYVYSIYQLGNPVGNIDLNVVMVSYLALMALSAVFVAVGVFASSLSSYQIVGLVVSLLINSLLYYGFDLFASLVASGRAEALIRSMGLWYHFTQLQRGVVSVSDILIMLNYIAIAWGLTLLSLRRARPPRLILCVALVLVVLNVANLWIGAGVRWDFTADKRYTIKAYSKKLLNEIANTSNTPIQINVYLEGNLNYSFQRLQYAIKDLLAQFNKNTNYNLRVSYIDPNTLSQSQQGVIDYMSEHHMPPITLAQKDRDGKLTQQRIYPYAQIISQHDTLEVTLLNNTLGYTAEQNLNASIEGLEFEFVDALRLLHQKQPTQIAFIEGHQELPRPYVYDVEEALSKYFFVSRGQIGNRADVLDDFKVIIIAGPRDKYTETEKYILDQYLMKGGRILWLVDGVYVSQQDLQNKGQSASIKNETNLDDLLFTYGLRINPALIVDAQCSDIVAKVGNDASTSVQIPFYYSPLLLPSIDNPITKGIADVKATFVNDISVLKTAKDLDVRVLLTSSDKSHLQQVPEIVDFDVQRIQSQNTFFNESFLTTALSLQGQFNSAFVNRMVPDSVQPKGLKTTTRSIPTKMIVVASSDIIRNEIVGKADQTQIMPLGYDRVSGRLYGNKSFIVNAVNWLANDDDWLMLRDNTIQPELLNKQMIYQNRTYFMLLNVLSPILCVALLLSIIMLYRTFKYSR